MTRVIRERSRSGVWVTRVIAPWHEEEKARIEKAKNELKGKFPVGTRKFSTLVLTAFHKRILAKLKEYELTGLTARDLADELGTTGGNVSQTLKTLCAAGYVIGDRRSPENRHRGHTNPIQWRLRTKGQEHERK